MYFSRTLPVTGVHLIASFGTPIPQRKYIIPLFEDITIGDI